MTTQPVEANVVLTSDNSQYDQAMIQSAGSTNDLGKAVDQLGQKISNLTKAAGKTLIGITAADVALITGATTAWANYEKQVSRLQAQSAILTRTNTQQSRVMKDYTLAVKELRSEYGTTTAEAAKLVEVLSKVTNVRQSRDLTDLSKVFVDMSHATGESSEGLATSLTNLQKIMGTPVNSANTRKYADMFTYLSAQTQGSAQGLIEFTAQMAPMAENMGMNTKQVAGFATAFSQAGQEGFAAANVFNKVTSDITQAIASGGPELKQYANIVGMTAGQFEKLEGSEQMVRIFEALHDQGDRATVTLQRLGLEGPRNLRAINAVINQQGGVRAAVGAADVGYDSKAAEEGAKAAESMSKTFGMLRQEIEKTAASLATLFGPAIEGMLKGVEKIASNVSEVVEGPLGEFLQMVMALVGGVSASVGPMLLFAGVIMKVAAAFAVWRNSAMLGVREGFRGGGMIGSENVGPRGAQLATDPRSSWLQRGMYNMGQPVGAALGSGTGWARRGWETGRGWQDPDYTPGPRRSALSYGAGGLARGLENFVNPQFDQARYLNPAARRSWLANQSPFARWADQVKLGGQMGAVAGAERDLSAVRKAELGVRQDPLLTNQERADKLANLKQVREETKDRLNSSRATERVTRESVNQQQALRELNRQAGSTSVGFRRLSEVVGGPKGLAAGLGGTAVGGVKAGAGAVARSGMGYPLLGMGMMGAQAAMGIESNTLMFGSMGAMMGPWGAAGGLAIGAAVDMAGANNDAADSIKNLQYQAEQSTKTGTGLGALNEEATATKQKVDDLKESYKITSKDYWFSMSAGAGSVKNSIEAIFGDSDIEELEKNQKKAQDSIKQTESVVRDLADAAGFKVTAKSKSGQRAQLEEFMSTEGAQRLADAGIELPDLIELSKGGGEKYTSAIGKFARPGEASGLWDRLRAAGGTGATMVDSAAGQKALQYEGNVEAFYDATNEIFVTALETGKDYTQIMKEAQAAQKEIGIENSREYELQMAVFGKAQQAQGLQMSVGTRAGAFETQLGTARALIANAPNTESGMAQVDAMKQQTASAIADQVNYFKQLLLAQDQFDRQKARAQEDYAEQRIYQDYDYNLQRTRAEENFTRMRNRATADFYRGMRRAHYDFNLQRERQEEDFNHSVNIMAKQQAQGIYDIYSRVQTERTNSASWILSNAQDQLERMREQTDNLEKLRARGLSTNAIQQLGLNDPQNAQQLARFATELTPTMIRQFNRVAGTERIKAAKEIVTDPSSLEWREMRRGFRIARERAGDDFERQLRLSRRDFRRGLDQQDKDFKISMDQQAEDYETSVNRQEKAYKKSMDRAAEDMAHMADEISLSMEEVLIKSTERLTGSAKKQAKAVLGAFQDLKKDTTPEAVSLMKELANIFGFEYKEPKGATISYSHAGRPGDNDLNINRASGGVIPGWTPGRDVTTANVSGGEAVMRPEWTRAVGESAINAMNHQAKYGGFASGGVFWPVPGHDTSTYGGHDGVDINRGSGSDDYGDPIRAFRSGTITYVGSGHGYGDAIFERTAAGTVVYGHTSGQSVHMGQRVRAGQLIGQVGSTGNSSAPHLHFGIPGGTYAQAMALLAGAIVGGGGFAAMGDGGGDLSGLLRRRYPNAEQAARNMDGVHPLEPGMISRVINRFARQKIRDLGGGGPGIAGGANIGRQPNEHLNAQQIVHTGANRMGWGDQWADLYQLVMHESGFNPTAQNPTSSAYGMFQFLDSTWGSVGGRKTADPWKQTQYGLKYIKNRYGDPEGAWDFWSDNHWYGDGAVFDKAQHIGVGENGPEAVIPLNARGADFMMDVMGSVMGGRNVSPMGGGMSVYNTKIDRSTNFSGPITVQANDPAELINKLRSRQRVMALSRPVLTGSAA